MNILLLGPGTSRRRFKSDKLFGAQADEKITVLDRDPEVLKFWEPYSERTIRGDLANPYTILPTGAFNEIHAYEVLNLLPGNAQDFFDLWRRLHRSMSPAGRLYATVPHYRSQWIHAYPAPQRVYTLGLLSYLDRGNEVIAKEEGFRDLWPEPYGFRVVDAWDVVMNGEPQGFHFVLEKA